MKMVRMPRGAGERRLTDPQRAWPVRGVRIRKPAQDADGRRGFVQVTHAGDHVQDWLGCQAGDGSGADVMNAAKEPGREHLFQDGLLGLKSPGHPRSYAVTCTPTLPIVTPFSAKHPDLPHT